MAHGRETMTMMFGGSPEWAGSEPKLITQVAPGPQTLEENQTRFCDIPLSVSVRIIKRLTAEDLVKVVGQPAPAP